MIPTWVLITLVAITVAVALNRLSVDDNRWFFQLKRPPWLTFEGLIPLIWVFIFICGIASASVTWAATENWVGRWGLMGGYLAVEVAIMAYTPVMCKLRSLTFGTAIGAIGFILGCILATQVWPESRLAFALLLPYLLWSPIGTFVTWQMIWLNPGKA